MSAIPYYEYVYTALLLEVSVALSAIYSVKNELYEEVYRLHDDIDGEWYYYIKYEATLTVETLDKVIQILNAACTVASEIYDAIDTITGWDENETIAANDAYEELSTLCTRIEEIREFDTIIELSEFDAEQFVINQLQEEYAMTAYEENLGNCIESASRDATNIVFDLTAAAQSDIEELLSNLDKFIEQYSNIIDDFKSRPVKKISSEIDNT